MGAREDLLAAAHGLTARGVTPFSPLELIDEARLNGCAYPDSTLRTLIVGPMCVNSPNHHAVQYRDLERVGRGQYRLVPASSRVAAAEHGADASRRTQSPRHPRPKGPKSGADEWYGEASVQALVVRYLVSEGWSITRVADTLTRESGTDVVASRDAERMLVEVKGYPSTTYARGPKEGQANRARATQARQYFSHALLSGLLLRSENSGGRVVLAFPDFETYRTLARRVAATLAQIRVEAWLVTEDGTVRQAGGRGDAV